MTKSALPDAALRPVVSAKDWAAAYEAMLLKEKELTRARDALAAQRRRITPLGRQEEWEDTPDGRPQTPPYRFGRHDEYS